MNRYRYLILLLFTVAIFSCKQKTSSSSAATEQVPDSTQADTTQVVAKDQLIIPGKSIGHILLNEPTDSVIKVLGKPDKQDAAMGSVLMTWYAGHDTSGYETSVFAHHNMGGNDEAIAHITKIMVTSPVFKTADSISVGDKLTDIEKYYPLKKLKTYQVKGKPVDVYTAADKGISFEIDTATKECKSIVVHNAGGSPSAYINMH
ncbi:hypothetical protein [Mucilaginibacter segetis]|uniref:Uncharacterized protein n=1 Tax=Mucilaginibacter segetis TaxID=2793071 RepID=A0A934UN21_9SPHI|nr:hypothetical protein [Mucilaginibacter segetis]MBK0380318.1 hypothetical protein [Mucilaginibacter segetis]